MASVADPTTLQVSAIGDGLVSVAVTEDDAYEFTICSCAGGAPLVLKDISVPEIRRFMSQLRGAMELVIRMKGKGRKLHQLIRNTGLVANP